MEGAAAPGRGSAQWGQERKVACDHFERHGPGTQEGRAPLESEREFTAESAEGAEVMRQVLSPAAIHEVAEAVTLVFRR